MNSQLDFNSNPHSSLFIAQLLAFTIRKLFPHVTLIGGGSTSLGFYYDFIFEQPLTESMLEYIEVQLHRLLKDALPVRFISMMRENAQGLLEHQGHFLLAQRVGEEPSNILDLVQIEDFYGPCPSLAFTSTQEAGYAKLLEFKEFICEIQEEEVKVTRLVGVNRQSAKDLKKFIKNYESFLKKKDHRFLGPKLNLFNFSESMGSLGVVWHSKGLKLRGLLQNWLTKQLPELENQISTPLVIKQNFLKAGAEALDPFLFEGEEYQLRSSLLPQHLNYLYHYSEKLGDLPWKISEYASVYRQYPEAQQWGLFCSCSYLMDQTTICCLKKQVVSELISSLHFIEQFITIFDFEAQWYLIASRQKSLKARQEQEAIGWLKQAIQANSRSYPFLSQIEEEEEGEGPRLELRIRDVLGREWTVSTLSVIQHLKRVKLLADQQGEEQSVKVVLKRQVCGSLDRLIALLIERYEGEFPFWLAPEQVRILAIGEANQIYAKQVCKSLQQKGLRVELDLRQTKLSIRVHEAERESVPYLVLIGEQERIRQKISVRVNGKFNQNQSVDLETFLSKLYQESLPPFLDEKRTMLKGESESA